MAWIQPKTDWNPGDGIKASDLNRIEDNIAYLRRSIVLSGEAHNISTGDPIDMNVVSAAFLLNPEEKLYCVRGYVEAYDTSNVFDNVLEASYRGGTVFINRFFFGENDLTRNPPHLFGILKSPVLVVTNTGNEPRVYRVEYSGNFYYNYLRRMTATLEFVTSA